MCWTRGAVSRRSLSNKKSLGVRITLLTRDRDRSLSQKKPGVMSIKAYKYRLYANKQTPEKLQWVLDRCREWYNAGLQERRDAYEMGVERHPGSYDEEVRKQ
jgi:hypothetical protein